MGKHMRKLLICFVVLLGLTLPVHATVLYTSLLDEQTATTDGAWVFAPNDLTIHCDLEGGTATVQLHGSNKETKPADNDDEIQLGSDITTDVIYSLASPLRWVKASISSYSSGTINCDMTWKS